MQAVMEIERLSFDDPWTHIDFVRTLQCSGVIALAVEIGNDIVGFMVYELRPRSVKILNIAVHPKHRQSGIGRMMLSRLIAKLSENRRQHVFATVRERNLAAQLFFRACGFRCVAVLHGHYETTGEDAYKFRFSI
jgi:ribosomal-protein-alanine N-acetyltransferase